ncbi:MAG TPA: thermonuclease family protein [Actinomycetota bacterium]|nr:thermonuclease family protein [Actinomycetota bacterium]
MRRAVLVAALAVLVAACTSTPGRDTSEPGAAGGREVGALVTRVVDGDTAEMLLDGREVDVRFIGIDTPESVAPDQPIECFGRRASAYTRSRLEGRTVRLEFDVERQDRFGRTLAYVWVGGELFNETLVAGGYAVVTTFPPNVRYVDRFIAAQRSARGSGLGIWGACP